MTARFIYVPHLIESAEQAEKLPEGTPAISEHDFVRERCINGWTGADGRKLYSHAAMIGYRALVPIEAEEETREHLTRCEETPRAGEAYRRPATMTRLVTPWQRFATLKETP